MNLEKEQSSKSSPSPLTADIINDEFEKGHLSAEEALKAASQLRPSSRALRGVRTFTPESKAVRIERYMTYRDIRKQALNNGVPFIHPDNFKLVQGLVLIGGVSGQGKSTTAANILAGLIKHSDSKKAVIMTNEENDEAVINRVACILEGINYYRFHEGEISAKVEDMVTNTALKLHDQIEVVSTGQWDMSILEDVKSVLEYAGTGAYNLAIIDYFQTITSSRAEPLKEPIWVSKDLGHYLQDYGKRVTVPVIVFAQLKTNKDGPNMKDRVENDKTIYNHAHMVIEAIPDFELKQTKFVIHKDRYNVTEQREIEMKYVDGMFIAMEDSL